MRGTSAEETLRAKEVYECLSATHGDMICAYRTDIRRFTETQFKEAVQYCGQLMIYCGVVFHLQNEILEHRIKELTLGSCTLLLRATRMWTEWVRTMLWNFYFKAFCQRYNNLEMEKYKENLEQNFYGVEFHIFPIDYHKWGRPVFILEDPLQGGPTGLPKWGPMARNRVYLGH